ncbi:ParB/RepB/Spo0J family partition protein [Microbacterium sp.]|uniref:ParB/RepB/Spo0J family partition protein n=1 Tax=Microbacterium sp. TaxID=51671 RepID=UPI003F70AAE3
MTTGILEHLDPQTLAIETNVRTLATTDKGLVDSIRENGVLTPLLGWRDQGGTVHVRAGQRRTLAAREAGIATVPVYLVDADTEDEARRLVEQMVENEQRTALTDTDRVAAWRQMELAGLSVTAIARKTGTKRDRVETGLTVAARDTATALVSEHGITLDQAATLLEFDGDDDTVQELTRTATTEPGYFPVAVERARQERVAREAKARVEQEEAAKGHRILHDRPGWNETPYRLRMLTTADGDGVTAGDVQGKEGVSVHVATYYGGEARAEYYVDDPEALGLVVRDDVLVSEPKAGPMSDEQKAERKQIIANNTEWDAAETVRREWITTLLSRKTLPKDATAVIATGLTRARHLVGASMERSNSRAASLLGLDDSTRDVITGYLDAHPTRATHVALAVVLGGIERTTGRDSWRSPRADVGWYLQTLAAWGYALTTVEQIAAGSSVASEEARRLNIRPM